MTKLDRRERIVNMLIVDDEPVICEGLRYTIDWEKFGVNVVGEAYDGEEALRIIDGQPVDFVLSDVRMDGMDGIELAERLHVRHPDIRLVIISGYDDFEYARRAMRVGVKDYLLKPVSIEELVQVVQRIVSSIREHEREAADDEHLLWFSGVVNRVAHRGHVAPPPWNGTACRVIVSQLKRFAERFARMSASDYETVQNRWIRHLHDRLLSRGVRSLSVFGHKNELCTLALSGPEPGEPPLERILEETMLAWEGPGELICGVSAEYRELDRTGERIGQAREAMRHHALTDRPVLRPEDAAELRQAGEKPDLDYKPLVQAIAAALFKRQPEDVRSLVGAWFDALQRRRLSPHEAVQAYDELLVLLRERLRQSGLTQPEPGRTAPIDANVYNSYASIKQLALEEMDQWMRLVDQTGADRSHWIVERAKAYMSEHYKEDIKASEVAERLKITPSYFSLIFKQSTGKNFKEYMNELRMEQAKHLLATTHEKVFEIANEVGFKEYKYFVSVFKSYTGMTPKEFRAFVAAQ